MHKSEGKIKTLDGISASPGVTIGHAFIYDKKRLLKDQSTVKFQNLTVDESVKLFKASLSKAIENLETLKDKTENEIGTEEAAIFDAQILILEDEDYQSAVINLVKNGTRIDNAITEVIDYYVAKFEEMDNEYFKERAADIRDVGDQLINALIGKKTSELSNLEKEVIIVSQELTPSDTAEMLKEKVLGLVTEVGGATSHVAIIARSLNLPAIVGVKDLLNNVQNDQLLIVDGINGRVIINPDPDTISKYRSIQSKLIDNETELKKYGYIIAKTLDGFTIEAQANIGSVSEIASALENGADGVGLLRTEFLYLGRKTLPTEEELFSTFKDILVKMKGKPVILRTLDVGGDKNIPCIDLPTEPNPFLGVRGSRIVKDPALKRIIVTQLRAALRASRFGYLKIMFPMISTLREVLDLNNLVENCKNSLRKENYQLSDSIEVGIM
ncbi:MAG: phosphoenolpyruvate--protein phosphotransferase, partial [Candidatus Hodarchaeales archaeon]